MCFIVFGIKKLLSIDCDIVIFKCDVDLEMLNFVSDSFDDIVLYDYFEDEFFDYFFLIFLK